MESWRELTEEHSGVGTDLVLDSFVVVKRGGQSHRGFDPTQLPAAAEASGKLEKMSGRFTTKTL